MCFLDVGSGAKQLDTRPPFLPVTSMLETPKSRSAPHQRAPLWTLNSLRVPSLTLCAAIA